MANAILGFDFGSGSIKIAKVVNGTVAKAVYVTLPDNLVKDGAIVSYDAMADIIKKAVRENHIGKCPVAVVLPSSSTVLRRLEMPVMTVAQLELNLPFEFHDFLTMDKDNYYFDYLVNNIVANENTEILGSKTVKKVQEDKKSSFWSMEIGFGKKKAAEEAVSESAPVFEESAESDSSVMQTTSDEEESHMDLTAAAIPKDIINDYRDMFRKAGLTLTTAIPIECAFSNLISNIPGHENHEYCFINLGERSTTINIYSGSSFKTTRIKDSGLYDIETIIANDQNLDIHVAHDRLRTNFEHIQTNDNVLAGFNSIAADIRKTINFYKFSNRESDFSEAYVSGAGALIPSYRNIVASTADLSLHPISDLLPKIVRCDSDPSVYAAAIGAALQ